MSASGVRGMACILDENGRLSDLSAADLPPNEIQLPACGSAGVLQTFPNPMQIKSSGHTIFKYLIGLQLCWGFANQ